MKHRRKTCVYNQPRRVNETHAGLFTSKRMPKRAPWAPAHWGGGGRAYATPEIPWDPICVCLFTIWGCKPGLAFRTTRNTWKETVRVFFLNNVFR